MSTTMNANVFPISLYEELLPKLVAILELTQQPQGTPDPQAKHKLLQATNNFKNALAQAKEYALSLPGGEMITDEQDEVIAMLEIMKERKRAQLADFVARKVSTVSADVKMELDSVASTPFGSSVTTDD
ncbi:hypothetical protein D9619_003627 [Psilocybe cf. subviscida]|uniref:Mediator of RNA polymerase II transcription subunit 9 n=1 Tax=Psilocybe cf. subviscida TaxID=2480587 RepID=A0A8H5AVW2_9AGAR|nr:hypothetical protein D9619_003627 [Psilocybe cf. subviscida]